MILEYVKSAMKIAHYERLEDDGSYYGTINGFEGYMPMKLRSKNAEMNWSQF